MKRQSRPRRTKEQAALARKEKEDAYRRRAHARYLLFGKSNGLLAGLEPKEREFVKSVWKESWNAYLIERATGVNRYGWRGPRRNTRKPSPIAPIRHRQNWFRSQKARWIRFDVPRMMEQQRKEAEDGSTDSNLPQSPRRERLPEVGHAAESRG